MPIISIVIPTFNRGDLIIQTVSSILKNSFKNFEIIIVEQGKNSTLKKGTYLLKNKNIKYFCIDKPNASKAKNYGIRRSKGKYIAFTDDDCIVSTNWLKNIISTFEKNKNIDAIFGSVYEHKPNLHEKQICPSVFKVNKSKIITKPTYHKKSLGFGNNFIIKKSILDKYGGFSEWLGPGSMSYAAEDAEIAIRLLMNNKIIYYNKNVRIEHNRWLTPNEMGRQMFYYNCGEIACYGYLYLLGCSFAKKIIHTNFFIIKRQLRKNIIKYKKYGLKKYLIIESLIIFTNIAYELKGLLIAIYITLFNKITDRLRHQTIIESSL